MGWMVWPGPTAIFFVAIGVMLAGMTVWEIASPQVERKGFLPIVTTRGDRLFIGLLACAYANLVWVGVTDIDQWGGAIIGFVLLGIVMRWG